ncbi:MAG TPA: hypothetical protein VGL97_12545 [Bryobacteraceae bacterium]|jgi:hypothetical protein
MRARGNQRGSALLIVFVFAAIIAIMLYKEMPVVAFEAQRQKEQLLIDRGNEYKHAIRLYVRKFGTFPSGIEALEDTNRMRFLRHKFTDPFTGKDDWRFLHAGPGGVILDSKVKTNTNTLNGNSSGTDTKAASNTTKAGKGNSTENPTFVGFSNSFAPATGDDGQATVKPIRQRAPAVAANGNNAAIETGKAPGDNGALPGDSLVPSVAPLPGVADAGGETAGNGGNTASEGGGVGGNATASGAGNSPVNGSDPQAVLKSLLGNAQNPVAQQQAGQSTQFGKSTNGTITSGGGIAGVASIAKGHSIKLVNDQDDFSLWEFYYDLSKEANAAANNALRQNGNPAAANPNSTNQTGFGANSSIFSTNSNSSTSNSGNNSGNTTTTVPATPALPPTLPPQQ